MQRVNVLVEGLSDEGVAQAILRECGLSVGSFYGRSGKNELLRKLSRYNEAAKFSPWFALVDLDMSFDCAVNARNSWLPISSSQMCFRIAVREIESWLLCDRDEVASYLRVSKSLIPDNPDELEDPKRLLLNLAQKSRSREIREGLVPRPGSGAKVGPTYASDIRDFAVNRWRPDVASETSPSLKKCIRRVEEMSRFLIGK